MRSLCVWFGMSMCVVVVCGGMFVNVRLGGMCMHVREGQEVYKCASVVGCVCMCLWGGMCMLVRLAAI